MDEIILKAEHMFKEFGPTKAVTDVTLELHAGRVTGLVGENGSGKSTLSSMIAGVYPPTKGEMIYKGEPYSPKSVLDARKSGIQYLTQEQGTIDGMTVAENMFLGEEDVMSKAGMVNMGKINRRSKEILGENGLDYVDPKASIEKYSFEDRKMIETARALSHQPSVLIIDETTTALSQRGRDRIYEIIFEQKAKGTAILVISHDLDEVKKLCDEVVVMRDGAYIATLTGDEIEPDNIRRNMIGRDIDGSYYRPDFECSYEEEVVLKVENLSVDGIFSDISFDLHKGEILGIGGLSECGMHELLKTVFGAIKPTTGSVVLTEGNIPLKNTTVSIKNHVAYIPKDRDKESLFQATSIKDNIVTASLDKLKKLFFITPGSEKRLAKEEAERMEVKMRNIEQLARDLSGGNKQKVVVAKWLANDSKVFIMDCPTRGIDVGVKEKIYHLMNDLKHQGASILMVSEEMAELIGMADRIITMKDGRLSREFVRSAELSEAAIISAIV
ncbi:MAG: sugar ABC transporter ATP-binding protein [Clostridiales bacterium]|nr:sugar ABC transporter ATP-binding protein [Clostridiales bacterium]